MEGAGRGRSLEEEEDGTLGVLGKGNVVAEGAGRGRSPEEEDDGTSGVVK